MLTEHHRYTLLYVHERAADICYALSFRQLMCYKTFSYDLEIYPKNISDILSCLEESIQIGMRSRICLALHIIHVLEYNLFSSRQCKSGICLLENVISRHVFPYQNYHYKF